MNPVEKNCPYTGLRSFTEDEAVYFRGRDEHIEKSTVQLGEKKFLMVTGASGDGKSSIIYAGMIPFLKAGFLKTEYTRWAVVDFRPERDPFGNFAKALSKHFTHIDTSTIQTELSRGFSSLILLYKNSPLFVDETREDWINATEQERKSKRREAANLFILVDQFEEFFTNPENFYHGATSEYAALVVSTLLETARIALKENLPIYIVFTMRSDFIGQCVSFRGLPEYIGFSQFFIPRLNREEIKVVIRDPATLAGYKISDRLVERLLYDIEEGIDQLPILQHSLNRIWHFALEREEEMDLIHYAMAGGMAMDELMPADKERMRTYISSLPESIQQGYERPSLRNVLDLHANSLCLDAEKKVKGIDQQQVNQIIQATFKGLTKIDEERAVRNRMTVTEITSIINDEKISVKTVSDTLLVFRESGATFLKPYILSDDDETVSLKGNDVLDITHESLIRNWDNLDAWARQEDGHAKIYYELRNHLNHWVNSGHSSNFLLTVGALNYFETWRDELKPNAYWINRYEKNNNPHTTIEQSQQLLDQINLFLRKSKWKNIVGRTIVRYGMKNVVAVLVAVFTVISCSLLFVQSQKNQNSGVVQQVKEAGGNLISSNNVKLSTKSDFLISLYRQDSNYFYRVFENLQDHRKKVELDRVMIQAIISKRFEGVLVHYLIKDAIVHLNSWLTSTKDPKEKARALELGSEILSLVYHKSTIHVNQEKYKAYVNSLLNILLPPIYELARSPEDFSKSGFRQAYLNNVLEFALSTKHLSRKEIIQWLDGISILNNNENEKLAFYLKESPTISSRGRIIKKGVYQILGTLYSSIGDVVNTKRCYDSLLKYNPEYFAPSDTNTPPNFHAFSLVINLLLNGYRDEFIEANKYIAQKAGKSLASYYNDFTNACISEISASAYFNLYNYESLSVYNFEEAYLKEIYSLAINEIARSALNNNEKRFKTAMLNKKLGLHLAYCWFRKEIKFDTASVDSIFDLAFANFQKVDKEFLSKTSKFWDVDLSTLSWGGASFTNYQLFLIPLRYREYMYGDIGGSGWFSDIFYRYIIKNNLVGLYGKNDGVKALGNWFFAFEQTQIRIPNYYFNENLYRQFHPVVARYENDTSLSYAKLIKLSVLNRGLNNVEITKRDIAQLLKNYASGSNNFPLQLIFLYHLNASFDKLYHEKNDILNVFELKNYGASDNRLAKILLAAPSKLYDKELFSDYFKLLISCDSIRRQFKDNALRDNPEFNFIESISKMEDFDVRRIIFNIIKEADDGQSKITAYKKWIGALMKNGDYYFAFRAIPSTLSSDYNMIFYKRVLDDYRRKGSLIDDKWYRYYLGNLYDETYFDDLIFFFND